MVALSSSERCCSLAAEQGFRRKKVTKTDVGLCDVPLLLLKIKTGTKRHCGRLFIGALTNSRHADDSRRWLHHNGVPRYQRDDASRILLEPRCRLLQDAIARRLHASGQGSMTWLAAAKIASAERYQATPVFRLNQQTKPILYVDAYHSGVDSNNGMEM